MSIVHFFEDAGFDTLEALSADNAKLILNKGIPISIIFTDIDMPGSINGLQLAWIVSENYPYIRVVVGSGRSRPAESDLPNGAIFFPKPYDFTALKPAILHNNPI